jgi:predicted RND superfamily exporter protein
MHRLTALCVRHPWLTVLVALAVSVTAARSALRTELSVGMQAVLGADDPILREFEAFLARFGGGYPVLIAYECARPEACRTALDPRALEMADEVASRLTQAPHVSRVSSVATTSLLVASADLGIDARRLVIDGEPSLDPSLRRLALDDPLWRRTLLSPDGRAGAIAVELASMETEALLTVVEESKRALAPHRGDFQFHLVGEAVLWAEAHADTIESIVRVGIGTGGMLFIALLLLLRSVPGVLASLATIGAASLLSLGLLPVFGWRLSELTNGAATAILVIGCADCVHFVANHLETRLHFVDLRDSLVASSRDVSAPCFLTTATSAGSFACFGAGGAHSLVQFGVMAAIGICVAFIFTFTLLPALLRLFPGKLRNRRHSAVWQRLLSRVATLGTHRPGWVVAAAATLALAGAVGLGQLRVELGFEALWAVDHPVRRALDFVAANFERPGRLEVELVLPSESVIEDPRVIGEIVGIEQRLRKLEGVGEPRSIVTLLRRAHRLIRPDDTGADLPAAEGAIAELLTLVSAGEPGAMDPWLTLDQRRVRISAEVESLAAEDLIRLAGEADHLLRDELPPGWHGRATGPLVVAARWVGEFSRSQLTIVSASSGVVFLLIGLYLRSFAWALLAMVPNAVALLILFGTMGLAGVPMDVGSAIVAPIAIGIAADDTIHFLTAYARERRGGQPPLPALQRAIAKVGEAVIATSAALALGFVSLLTSPFPSISSLGALSSLAIVVTTLADLLLLPALIATAIRTGTPGRLVRNRGSRLPVERPFPSREPGGSP